MPNINLLLIMKKTSLKLIVVLLASITLTQHCTVEQNKNEYLLKVLNNLENIKSASYFSEVTVKPPGDTNTLHTNYSFVKEFVNPIDTFNGSSFALFQKNDTSKMLLSYNGIAKLRIDYDRKSMDIDSFKTSSLPYRTISEPFFHQAKSIIKYSLETQDSIRTELIDFGDSIKFDLLVPEIINFFGRPYIFESPYLTKEERYSRYEIWIRKRDDLPYKIRERKVGLSDTETLSNVEYNKIRLKSFLPEKYLPSDFKIKEVGKTQTFVNDLTGQKAPDWILNDCEKNAVSLNDFKSKVLVIEFMGIGCAPCHSAIPFLKQLSNDYQIKDFELVSIETWNREENALNKYKDNNMLNHTCLVANDDVMNKYHTQAVPVFFILDQERVIKKIIKGYGRGTTDKEIRDAIDELI
jgi:thiol-disulfide isomerase/thioredoxin